jgi:hypothetical protein
MLNQIGLKPIMDVAIMQIFCDMYELLPTSLQNWYIASWLVDSLMRI